MCFAEINLYNLYNLYLRIHSFENSGYQYSYHPQLRRSECHAALSVELNHSMAYRLISLIESLARYL